MWDVGDVDTYSNLQAGLEQLKASFPFLAGNNKIMSQLRMRYEPGEANKDITNIEYSPSGNAELSLFSKYINDDLLVLGQSRLGSLNQRQSRLLAALESSTRYKDCTDGKEAAEYPGAMILVRQAVPCILHLENRCGEKILKTLLFETIQLANKTNKEEEELLKKVELIANTRILGSTKKPATWKIPVANDSNKRVVQDLTMPNCHVWKFMKEFHEITAVCFDTTNDKEKARKEAWDKCHDLWMVVVEKDRKKEDFTDAEIEAFQGHCDKFIDAWLQLLPGDTGMTNYFHIVAASHLSYYLREWRNLYRFSQQGWEGINGVIKALLHKRSQHGGNSGKNGERNSKVEPIARWALRQMFFFSGNYKQVEYIHNN